MPLDADNESVWTPRADIFLNSNGEFTVKVDLAALRRENIQITRAGQRLLIAGQRPDPDRENADPVYVETAIPWGHFALAVDVPGDFDLNTASAVYQNGLLRIRVPTKSRQEGTLPG